MDSAFKELSAKVEADHKVQLNSRNVANELARKMNLDKVHETVTQWQVAESNRVKRAAEQADETREMLEESVQKSERQLERIRQQTSAFGGGVKSLAVGLLLPFALVLFSVVVVTGAIGAVFHAPNVFDLMWSVVTAPDSIWWRAVLLVPYLVVVGAIVTGCFYLFKKAAEVFKETS